MTRFRPNSLILSRRGFIRTAAVAGTGALLSGHALAASTHPSIAYMKQVGKDLLAAHRNGTVASFLRAIQRHADVPDIALYSLGQYRDKLSNSDRQRYFRGVAVFMSRYFADQSREFPVAKYELGEATPDGKDVLVASKVYLMSGQVYNVTWRLVWRNKGYKVSDAKVLGFSLIYLQRGIFTSYLSKRNGDVKKLMAALEG
jgi:phospholipid transport system substrate-binding protein